MCPVKAKSKAYWRLSNLSDILTGVQNELKGQSFALDRLSSHSIEKMYCFLIPINLRSFYPQFSERFTRKLTIANNENANDENGGEYYSIANIIPIIHDIVISLFPSQISTSLFSDLSLVCFCVVGVRERGGESEWS